MVKSELEKGNGKEKIEGILEGNTAEKQKEKDYADYVKQITPKNSLLPQMLKAFVVGGIICVSGQAIQNIGTGYFGLDQEMAGRWCSMLLVLASAILTGTGIYPVIASFGGAGALVPITGFANSVAACAHGFKVEGQVFGIGARIFQIAGPVILYGILTTAALGCIYWFVGTI